MASFVLTDAHVSINSVDLSDHVKSVEITYEAEELDNTAMGATARTRIAGFKAWSATLSFNQDFASGEVDATLFPLVGAAAFACIFRPDSDPVGAANPEFTGNATLPSYQPLSGSVGEVATINVTLAGSGALARAVA